MANQNSWGNRTLWELRFWGIKAQGITVLGESQELVNVNQIRIIQDNIEAALNQEIILFDFPSIQIATNWSPLSVKYIFIQSDS